MIGRGVTVPNDTTTERLQVAEVTMQEAFINLAEAWQRIEVTRAWLAAADSLQHRTVYFDAWNLDDPEDLGRIEVWAAVVRTDALPDGGPGELPI
jgi:hypothetical protein